MNSCAKKLYKLYKLGEEEFKPTCENCFKRQSSHNLISDELSKKICDGCVYEFETNTSSKTSSNCFL